MQMEKNEHLKQIYVAGASGMVGSAIVRRLLSLGYAKSQIITHTSAELDLRDTKAVRSMFTYYPDVEYVINAAGKVGGIFANMSQRADFLFDNTMIALNIVDAANRMSLKKIMMLGSSCIYPRMSEPIKESHLLSNYLEETNQSYAIAKIAGVEACRAYNQQYANEYITLMPTNMFGRYDNYDLETSHVIPALIAKLHKAKAEDAPRIQFRGTGEPLREFMYVDDFAKICCDIMHLHITGTRIPELLNVGTDGAQEMSIREAAAIVAQVVGYEGTVVFRVDDIDTTENGVSRKLMDCKKLNRLFPYYKHSLTNFKHAVEKTYAHFLNDN